MIKTSGAIVYVGTKGGGMTFFSVLNLDLKRIFPTGSVKPTLPSDHMTPYGGRDLRELRYWKRGNLNCMNLLWYLFSSITAAVGLPLNMS